ncbi:hypothetical protein [Spiroplasma endosymbiont of Polydrusus formosus]|uniref:hypothetical protein n=1 Tax=Spiroplasma endosymbiont of Polydrusus formosus TaxID=3139326 RepID=UPI0035B56508
MNITESIKFDKLKEENETLLKELAEKEQEINSFKQQIDMAHNFNQNLGSEIEELKQQRLFKEDFKKIANTSFSSKGHTSFTTWELKDNSLYDKLPSKEDKTCI